MGIMTKILYTTADVLGNATASSYNTVAVVQTEETEQAKIKRNISAINTELNAAYAQIGKKYFEYVAGNGEAIESLGVDDVMKMALQKQERKAELEKALLAIEKRLKDQVILQEKAKAQADVDVQIEKLNSAKAMGVISENEYAEKISKVRKRLDNFEAIRNIEKQFEMGIITFSEKNAKLSELT